MKTKAKKAAVRVIITTALLILTMLVFQISAFAADTQTAAGTAGGDMWDVANKVMVDVYNHIVKISTVLAGLMSAVAVIGVKISNSQQKSDQRWEWLKRIWLSWIIINGIGAFIAYIRPLFSGFANINF